MKLLITALTALALFAGYSSSEAADVTSSTVWYKAAEENQTFSAAPSSHVRFGTPQKWVYQNMDASGKMACTNATFGRDPNPNVVKQCMTDDTAAKSKFIKIMTVGDSMTGFYRYGLLPAVSKAGYFNVDWVGNATYTYADGQMDPDSNGYGGYKGLSLLVPAGQGSSSPVWDFLHADEGDAALWFQGQAPDLVLLMLGTNDCNLDADQAQQAAKELQAYSRVLAAARASNPDVRLLVAQLPKAATCEKWDAALNAVIPGWATANTTAQSPVVVVDQYTGFDVSMLRDGTHPGDPMIEAMAVRWFAAMKPYLKLPDIQVPVAPSAAASAAPTAPASAPAAVTPAPLPAATPLLGYSLCAKEGSTCSVVLASHVIYGTVDKHTAELPKSASFKCDNTTFTDPNVGTPKSCWTKVDQVLTSVLDQRWMLTDSKGVQTITGATDAASCAAYALSLAKGPTTYSCSPFTSVTINWVTPEPPPPPVIIKPTVGVVTMHGGLNIDPNVILQGSVGTSELRLASTTELPPASDIGDFRTVCEFAKMGFFDPIAHFGVPNSAHLHTFYGNTGINENTTPESLRTTGNSTCRGGIANRSAYWVPTMVNMDTGLPVPVTDNGVYYKAGYMIASKLIQPIPAGLRMIAGNMNGNSPETSWGSRFKCLGGPNDENDKYGPSIPDCDVGATMYQEIFFPQCWDGKNLDSPDHKSHMADVQTLYNPYGFKCPDDHPVPIPAITFNIAYYVDIPNPSKVWRLSSDNYDVNLPGGYSGHGDWYNGWQDDVSKAWAKNCIQAQVDCHSHLLGDGRMMY